MNDLEGWFIGIGGWFIGIGLAIIIAFCFYGVIKMTDADAKAKHDWYTECEKDHKRYECDVLWGQSKGNDSTVFIPMVIPSH